MEIEQLQQVYKNQLLRVGVDPLKVEQAIQILTREELQMISQILPTYAVDFPDN